MAASSWVSSGALMEALRHARGMTRSGRREKLGFTTVRDLIGFEKRGKRKLIVKRKRPKRRSLLAGTPFRAKSQ